MIRFSFSFSFLAQTDYHRIIYIISIALGFGRVSILVYICFLERISPSHEPPRVCFILVHDLCSMFLLRTFAFLTIYSLFWCSQYLPLLRLLLFMIFSCIQSIRLSIASTSRHPYIHTSTHPSCRISFILNTTYHPSIQTLNIRSTHSTQLPCSSFHVLRSVFSSKHNFTIWKHILYHTLSY